jgi:hypothetical protein
VSSQFKIAGAFCQPINAYAAEKIRLSTFTLIIEAQISVVDGEDGHMINRGYFF